MGVKNILGLIYHFRHLWFLLAVSIFYFSTSDWTDNASDEEIKKYLERFDIEKPKEFLEPVKLLIQAIIALIFLVMIFYVGKIHDLTKDYINKLGDLEEAILTIKKNKTHLSKSIEEEIKKKSYYEIRLKYIQTNPAMIIIVSVMSVGMFIFIFFNIFESNVEDDARKLTSLIFSLMSAMGNFVVLWAFFNYMITNRQHDYKNLIYSIAKLRVEMN